MPKSSDSNDTSQRRSRSLGTGSKFGAIALLVLAGVYSFAAPRLNTHYGWNLPQLTTDAQGNVQLADSPRHESAAEVNRNPPADDLPERATNESTTPTTTSESTTNQTPVPVAATRKSESEPKDDLRYGLLREISRDRFMSPAGLLYTPGSAEGHRLEHLRRHTKDDPGRPGPHGVFDGDMQGALMTIDRAYERAKKGERTTKKEDGDRTIYTVDMGARVGYVGGREGGRKRKPMARRVRMVLEDNRLITAYPL